MILKRILRGGPTSRIDGTWAWYVLSLVALVILSGMSIAWLAYGLSASRKLHAAIAESQQSDLNWTLARLESSRVEIPDGENSALVAQQALKQIVGNWTAQPLLYQGRISSGNVGESLTDRLHALDLGVAPSPSFASELRTTLDADSVAIATARTLANMRVGRSATNYSVSNVAASIPHLDLFRLASLLEADSARRSSDGDADGALESCRAILGVARSIGDEPSILSTHYRMWISRIAVNAIRRALALGEASDQELKRVQELLADEAGQSLLIHGCRGERAKLHDLFDKMSRGEINPTTITISPISKRLFDSAVGFPFLRNNHASVLAYLNEAIKVCDLPVREQITAMHSPDIEISRRSTLAMIETTMARELTPAFGFFAMKSLLTKGELIACEAQVAIERYRVRNGRWPVAISEIGPDILPTPLLDPFDERPVRMIREDHGWRVYTIGADGTDDRGRFNPKSETQSIHQYDLGGILYDLEARGLHPGKELPDKLFATGTSAPQPPPGGNLP